MINEAEKYEIAIARYNVAWNNTYGNVVKFESDQDVLNDIGVTNSDFFGGNGNYAYNFAWLDSIHAKDILIDIDTIPNGDYSFFDILNKNYIVVKETLAGGESRYYYFFITKARQENYKTIRFSLELDVFTTFKINSDYSLNHVFTTRKHCDRYYKDSSGNAKFIPNNKDVLTYDEDVENQQIRHTVSKYKVPNGNSVFSQHCLGWLILYVDKVGTIYNSTDSKIAYDEQKGTNVNGLYRLPYSMLVAPIMEEGWYVRIKNPAQKFTSGQDFQYYWNSNILLTQFGANKPDGNAMDAVKVVNIGYSKKCPIVFDDNSTIEDHFTGPSGYPDKIFDFDYDQANKTMDNWCKYSFLVNIDILQDSFWSLIGVERYSETAHTFFPTKTYPTMSFMFPATCVCNEIRMFVNNSIKHYSNAYLQDFLYSGTNAIINSSDLADIEGLTRSIYREPKLYKQVFQTINIINNYDQQKLSFGLYEYNAADTTSIDFRDIEIPAVDATYEYIGLIGKYDVSTITEDNNSNYFYLLDNEDYKGIYTMFQFNMPIASDPYKDYLISNKNYALLKFGLPAISSFSSGVNKMFKAKNIGSLGATAFTTGIDEAVTLGQNAAEIDNLQKQPYSLNVQGSLNSIKLITNNKYDIIITSEIVDTAVLENAYDVFYKFGYAVNRFTDSEDWFNRARFNYVKLTENVDDKIVQETNKYMSMDIRRIISDKLKNGITFWDKDSYGDYTLENYEKSLKE